MQIIDPERFDAVLFDLDGVVTDTASVHAHAWKKLFDEFLEARAKARGEPFVPFDLEEDYRTWVDGKPRYEGVRSFLASRAVELPFGDPADPPGTGTVCALGNIKNEHFNRILRADGVTVFPTSVDLIRKLRREGIRVAVVSSSKNTPTILEVAGLEDLFDLRFDGNEAARLGLEGKPTPDTYLKAAELLGVPAERAVVVEDAISGVEAGRAGHFGLVVGVDRHGEAQALKEHGADVVVSDLGELD
ncbi:MAG: beta-phosphoglucomutase family hydrolase [Planctomycetota bacterium]